MIFYLLACLSDKETETAEVTLESALIEAIEQDIANIGATAFAMAVLKDGEVSWSDGFGTDTKDGSPVTADTLFRVASLTKPMTAVLTLQQVEAGCLELETPVDEYIADFVMAQQPELASTLTVDHALSMTGGFTDYQLQSGEDGDGQIEPFLLSYLNNGYFLSNPGRMYNYSNPNFVVAGRLVELCTEESFRSVMEQSLWGPLQMNRTTFQTEEVVADGAYAIGVTEYWPDRLGEEVSVDAETYAASHLWPAMGTWSSVNDLAKLALFLLEGDEEILSTSLFNAMTTVHVDTEEGYENKGYGYGLFVKTGISMGGEQYPVKMISHTGSIYGYSSHMYLIPELNIGVVAIINRDKAVPQNSIPLALNLSELVETYEPNVTISEDHSPFIGEYYNAFNIGSMFLTDSEAGLTIEIPALDDANIGYEPVLEAVRPDNFSIHYPDGSFENLSFLRDSEGSVEYIRSRNYVGEKSSSSSIRPSHSRLQTTGVLSNLEHQIHID